MRTREELEEVRKGERKKEMNVKRKGRKDEKEGRHKGRGGGEKMSKG